MGFGTPPTVVTLEGDYTDWTIYDSFDDDQSSNGTDRQYALVNEAETEALLFELFNLSARKYTIATKSLASAVSEYLHPGWWAGVADFISKGASIQFTYVTGLIRVGVVGNGITIWKNGTIIKTLTSAELGLNTNEVYSVSISRSGKYIFVSGLRTATGNMAWVVLVGS